MSCVKFAHHPEISTKFTEAKNCNQSSCQNFKSNSIWRFFCDFCLVQLRAGKPILRRVLEKLTFCDLIYARTV